MDQSAPTKFAARKCAGRLSPAEASRKYVSCPEPRIRVDAMTVVIPRTIALSVYIEYSVFVSLAFRWDPPRATAPNSVRNMSRKRSFADRAANSMFLRHSVSSCDQNDRTRRVFE